MSKLRMLTLVGLMAAALTPLYGCGSECAEGTTDKDGECVVAANGCAEGTTLQNGECLLDTTGCGEGTMFSEGECIPAEGSCDGNTTFDEGTLTCVPNTDIICGAGTKTGDDGYCVPSEEACNDKTVFDNGRCIIAAASCGAGTALDANTGECILDEAGCGTGLAYEAESGTCIPTEQICDVGTKFEADSGLCLPDSCSSGDVIVDGICMTPAEDLARNPDLTETENNDPALGGTAEMLVVNPVDDDAYSFVGAIGSPSDLDSDGALDQDVDVFQFEANAGEWFEIMVQSTGLQAPAFVVEGPDDFIRYSPMGRARDAARQVVVPVDGTYTVTVLPSLVLQSGGEVNLIGGDDWTYVGTLNAIAAPDATEVDLAAGDTQFSGDYVGLTDNLFNLSGLTSGEIVSLEFSASGEDTDAIAMMFDATGVLTHSEAAANRSKIEFVAAGTSATVLLDWAKIDGPATDFEVNATVIGYEKTTTLTPGTSETFQLMAEAEDQIVATQTNPQSEALSVTIVEDATAEELDANAALASGEALLPLVSNPGTYTVTFTNDSPGNVDATMIAKIRPPFRFGQLDPGMRVSTGPFEFADDTVAYATFSVGPGQIIEVSQDNEEQQYHRVDLYDANDTQVTYDSSFYPRSYTGYSDSEFIYHYSEQGGSFRVELEARDDVIAEEIFIYTYTPTPVDLLTTGTSVSETGPALMENQRQFYRVNVGEDGKLKITGQSDNTEDIDVYAYDMTMSSEFSSTTSGGIDTTEELVTGQYLVAIEPDEDTGSHNVTFELLAPPPPPQFSSAPGLAIPDNDTVTGVSDTLTVTGCPTITDTTVYLNITHSWRGDLDIDLTSPAGTKVRLWEDSGGSSDDLIGWMPLEWTPANSLSTFAGETGNGDWTINVYDDGGAITGTLNEWGLTLSCQ